MKTPRIERAVPARRYSLGQFSVVVLREVETSEPTEYHHVLAVVPEGSPEPLLYVVAERAPDIAQGPATVIRVIAENGERVFGPDDRWLDLEAFTEDALAMVKTVLQLQDEQAHRLL